MEFLTGDKCYRYVYNEQLEKWVRTKELIDQGKPISSKKTVFEGSHLLVVTGPNEAVLRSRVEEVVAA